MAQLGTQTRRKISDLNHYYKNPRVGDVPKIKASLQELGQFKEIVVNVGTITGRPNEVLAGNHTMKAAVDLGWDELDCREIDVDEVTAAKIVAADNKTGDAGTYDEKLLADLLSDLPDLIGTGFDAKELDDLMRETASGADSVLASFSHSLEQTNVAQREQEARETPLAPPSSDTVAPTFTDGPADPSPSNVVPAAESAAAPAAPADPIQPPADPEPYFTVSYTLLQVERDVVLAAIRKIQADDPSLKSPQAIVEICRRSL